MQIPVPYEKGSTLIKPLQPKPGSSKSLSYKGFESSHQGVDHRRMKFAAPTPPKGTQLTDEMLNQALEVVSKHDNVQCARFTREGDFLVTIRKMRSASKTLAVYKQLVNKLWHLIVNTLISECRKAKKKVKQATAEKRQTNGFLNDKTRTQPALART